MAISRYVATSERLVYRLVDNCLMSLRRHGIYTTGGTVKMWSNEFGE